MGIGVWFLDNWEKTKTSSCWILDIICNYLIISLEIVEKEIIQTNNLSKNEKIQRNNSAKSEKIQRNNLKSVGQIQLDFLISERSVRGGWDVKSTSHWSQSLYCRAFQAFWVRGVVNIYFCHIVDIVDKGSCRPHGYWKQRASKPITAMWAG